MLIVEILFILCATFCVFAEILFEAIEAIVRVIYRAAILIAQSVHEAVMRIRVKYLVRKTLLGMIDIGNAELEKAIEETRSLKE